MANNYFQFKQFRVQQENCAMKVCTDACIFGAFVASQINRSQLKVDNMLDIGGGTGLLPLMVAQKTNGKIDSIEIDAAACQQAITNFEQSPWKQRLTIHPINAMEYTAEKKYDYIISNPPFFEGDLKSGNHKKNTAKHDAGLTLEQLLAIVNKRLSPDGFFAILLPYQRLNFFIEMAKEANYFLNEQLLIQHTNAHPFFRGVLFFSRAKTPLTTTELAIKKENGFYTPEFIELLKDYYLYL